MRLPNDPIQPPIALERMADARSSGCEYGERTRITVRVLLAKCPDLAERDALGLVLRVMAN